MTRIAFFLFLLAGVMAVVVLIVQRSTQRHWDVALYTSAGSDPRRVAEALAHGANPNLHFREARQRTALMVAADWGNLDAVKILVKAGAEIDARDAEGRTPLMFAAGQDRVSIVKYLLAQGADVHAKTNTGMPLVGSLASTEAILEEARKNKTTGRKRVSAPATPK